MSIINKISSFIVKLFLLNIIFILTTILSLGILIGPSMSALFCLCKDTIDGDIELYGVFSKYISKIKEKFKYAFLTSLILLIFGYILFVNIRNLKFFSISSINIIYALQLIAIFEIALTGIYGFYLNGVYKFDSFKDFLLTSFFFVNRYILISILIIITIFILYWSMSRFFGGFLLIFIFSILFTWISLLFKPIFKKFEIHSEET